MIIKLKNKAPYLLSCVLLSSAALLSVGCSSDDAAEQASSIVEETADKASEMASDAKEAVVEGAEKTSDIASDAEAAVTDTVEKAAEKATY